MSGQNIRTWQAEVFNLYLKQYAEGERRTLWEATPGAGKTTAALRLVKHQIITKCAQKAFIVVPTSHLRIQWAKAALAVGIHLDNNFGADRKSLTSDFHGAVVTYQQFKGNLKLFSDLASKSVVVLDEVHHSAEGLSWGTAIIKALKNARFILCLSGTAFRSDNNPIPFVKYDQEGISTPDYTYSYSRAIREKVCRPAAIFTYGGDVSWMQDTRVYKSSFSDNLDYIASARRHKSALDPASGWVRPMILDANQMLISTRKEQPNAGGLIVCADQKSARLMAKLVHEVCGEKPILVLSDDAGASRKISSFSSSSTLWLVACNMVSEGVDIPRLRIGVYATTIKTKMYFRQFLGRIVRRSPQPNGPQVAYLYLPADPTLRKLAEEIEAEAQHYLNKPLEDLFGDLDPLKKERKEPATPNWTTLEAYNSGVDSIILHGNQLSLFAGAQSQGADNLLTAINQEVETKLAERITRSEENANCASLIRKLVGTLHKKSGKTHAQIHSSLNKAQSVKSQSECTFVKLKERVTLLEKLIEQSSASSFPYQS